MGPIALLTMLGRRGPMHACSLLRFPLADGWRAVTRALAPVSGLLSRGWPESQPEGKDNRTALSPVQ